MRFLALALLIFAAAPAAARPRGLIIVDFDDLRPDRLDRARGGAPLMPRLSAFAAGGVVFENAVSQAPWTLPSTMSLFTSLYPHRHGVTNRFDPASGERKELTRLGAERATLAQVLRGAGFRTAAFTGGAGLDGASGFSRGFEVYSDSTPFAGFESTMGRALDWLKGNSAAPFFLFVHGYDVHGQYSPPPVAASKTDGKFLQMRQRTIDGAPLGIDAAGRSSWAALYDERAALADERFGKFWDSLGDLRDKTVVVVLSDHGDELFEHGGVDHGMKLYDEAIRALLVFRVPGEKPLRVAGQVRLIDVMPTLLDLLGVDSPAARAQMQGESLVPALRGKATGFDALSETDFLFRASKRSVRSKDGWKLIFDLETLGVELYDVRKDTAEAVELSAKEPGRVKELQARLRELLDLPPAH
jgi:arylsulfatase A-like enzyme